MNTGCFSLGSTSRFLLVRFFAVASIIGVGDIGAGFSDESLAYKSLPRTQQRSIVAAGSARTAPHPGGPARFFTINEILDKSDRPAALPMPGPDDEPFGMTAFVQPEDPLATKWDEILVDLAEEEPILKECVADESKCTSAAARFVAIVMTISQQIGRARLELANQEVNSAIRYKTDAEQWGVADRWSTPLSTFATGFGDCEDYAIAKYVALRQSGVPASDLRMVLGYDSRGIGGRVQGQMTGHAVLAARNEGSWLVLDKQWRAAGKRFRLLSPLAGAVQRRDLGARRPGGDAYRAAQVCGELHGCGRRRTADHHAAGSAAKVVSGS